MITYLNTLVLISFLSVLANGHAKNVSFEKKYYQQKIRTPKEASEATQVYDTLLKLTVKEREKAILYNYKVKTLHFMAKELSSAEDLEKVFQKGMELSRKAINLLEDRQIVGIPKNRSNERDSGVLAESYYYYALSLLRWCLLKKLYNTFWYWGEILENIKFVIGLGHRTIDFYGPNRVWALGLMNIVPFYFNSSQHSRELIKEAYNATKNGRRVSVNGENNILYIKSLLRDDRVSEAINIIRVFLSYNPKDLNPQRNYETQIEQEKAKSILSGLKTSFSKY